MRSRGRLGNQSRSARSLNAQPNSEFRGKEISASQFERLTSRPPRTQPPPCKRYAALARRRNFQDSSLFGRRRADLFLAGEEFSEARIVADRVPYRIDLEALNGNANASGNRQ